MKISINILALAFLLIGGELFGQITSGHVVYERKTNLYKKFKSPEIQRWIPENSKSKVDVFDLYFTDSLSFFGPQENNLKEVMSWTTSKNKVYQDFQGGSTYAIKEVFGEPSHLQDKMRSLNWKILPGKRKIAGYDCQKAMWEAGDTLRIYAWFANELMAPSGPESFHGLPGVILGLATEDGGVIYFAKQVLLERVDPGILKPEKYKGKVYSSPELKTKLEKDFGKEAWGKTMLAEMFGVW